MAGVNFAVVLACVGAFMGVVDDVMEIGWELTDPTTLTFTMIVSPT